ncbi:MAG: hypothetical protein ACE5E6_11230 [Phycisphaerae bacterium]
MSVLVCIPTAHDIHALTAAAAFRICAGHADGAEFQTFLAQPTDYARNLCVRHFLGGRHTHMLFLDSDILPPDNVLEVMLGVDQPIVCGIYPLLLDGARVCTCLARRTGEHEYAFLDDFPETPFEVDAAGLGCTLIARDVFSRVKAPWFLFEHRPDGQLTGEDFHFFESAARVGYRPLVIPQIQCSHFKTVDLMDVIRAVHRAQQTPDRVAAEAPPV